MLYVCIRFQHHHPYTITIVHTRKHIYSVRVFGCIVPNQHTRAKSVMEIRILLECMENATNIDIRIRNNAMENE